MDLPQRKSRRLATALALPILATTFLVLGAPVAQAEECKTFRTPLGNFTVCGAALNKAASPMYAASLDGGSGAKQCTVRDKGGKVLGRNFQCVSREVRTGRTSPHRDTDAIMFNRSFRVNGHPFKAGEWVKIRFAVCLSPATWIQPQCFAV